jgi:hypothetical protein
MDYCSVSNVVYVVVRYRFIVGGCSGGLGEVKKEATMTSRL